MYEIFDQYFSAPTRYNHSSMTKTDGDFHRAAVASPTYNAQRSVQQRAAVVSIGRATDTVDMSASTEIKPKRWLRVIVLASRFAEPYRYVRYEYRVLRVGTRTDGQRTLVTAETTARVDNTPDQRWQ